MFKARRRDLERSPTLRTFFTTAHYTPNCDFLISFTQDPAAVFAIVNRYLEQGPEIFDATRLKVDVYRKYKTNDRIIVLIRLCRLAHSLGLWYLREMAYNILVDGNRFIEVAFIPTLASIIFNGIANHHHTIEDWFWVHASHYFLELQESDEWAKSLQMCDVLRQHWEKMVKQNMEVINTFESEPDDSEVLPNMIHRMSSKERDRAISLLGEKQALNEAASRSLANQKKGPISMIPTKKKANGSDSDSWEDISTPSPVTNGKETKDEKPLSEPRTSLSRSNSAETAKARQVMGIDKPDGNGLAKKKEKGRKSRIMFPRHQ